MRHGDLAASPVPSVIIVFEGAIATITEEDSTKYYKALSRERYYEAIDCWSLNPRMLAQMNRVIYHQDINIEVVTWLVPEMVPEITDILDSENVSVTSVFASDPGKMARDLIRRPEIWRVYDPDPAHVFTYGKKGVVLTDVNQVGRD